jgi:type VI secretion system protein ImpK
MPDRTPDDPSIPPDGTLMRPRPGAGRRGAPPAAAPSPFAAAGQRPVASPAPPAFGAPAGDLGEFIGSERNPILQAAAPLLLLAARLGTSVQQASIATLRQQAVQEVRTFDDRLRSGGVSREDALVARYVLCTFVDSAVLNTPWGAQGDWAGQSLLVIFHKEVSGGEKFFEILKRLQADPSRYVNLIELLYVCLALGYEGKYRHDPNGALELSRLQHGLYEIIREHRRLREEELSPRWQGTEDRRNPIIRYVPWWTVAAAGAAVLLVTFLVFHARLAAQAQPIETALAAPAVAVNYAAAPSPPTGLQELLAPEIARGLLTVEDLGGKTVITLTAPNLFPSASARLNPGLAPTVRKVAQALNQLAGRIVVVGHTDDLPVHSFLYANNLELSRARAVSVADLMKPDIADFGRVQWQGVGSKQPRYLPENTPENRARNRRVEIIYLPAAEGWQVPPR